MNSTISSSAQSSVGKHKKSISSKLIKDNPNYIPIEAVKSRNCRLDCFDRKHLMVPCSFPFYLVIEHIRQKISKIDSSQALFCFVNNKSIVKPGTTVGEVYTKYKAEDGFLYVEFSDVNVYG